MRCCYQRYQWPRNAFVHSHSRPCQIDKIRTQFNFIPFFRHFLQDVLHAPPIMDFAFTMWTHWKRKNDTFSPKVASDTSKCYSVAIIWRWSAVAFVHCIHKIKSSFGMISAKRRHFRWTSMHRWRRFDCDAIALWSCWRDWSKCLHSQRNHNNCTYSKRIWIHSVCACSARAATNRFWRIHREWMDTFR